MKYFNLNDLNTGRPLANCKVMEGEKFSTLLSYTTEVAKYNKITGVMNIKGYYSVTTGKHLNAFLDFYGFDRATKKELENWDSSAVRGITA